MEQFFGFSKGEFAAFRNLRESEMHVYCCLRERADFKSGRLEHPTALKMTAASIARDISLPGRSGVPALVYSRRDVERSLSRLEDLGFVDERSREGRFIRLRLPMVAASTAKGEPSQTRVNQKNAQGEPRKSLRVNQTENAETVVARGFQEFDGARVNQESGLGCNKKSARVNQTETDKIAETVAAQGTSDGKIVPFSTFFSTKKSVLPPKSPQGGEETPSSSTPENPNPLAADGGSQEESEKTETEIRRLRTVVADAAKACSGFIQCLNSERSTEILAGWVARGWKDREIEDACERVIENPDMKPYVDSIDTLMRQQAVKLANFRRSYCAG